MLVGYLALRYANIGTLTNAGDAPWFVGLPASARFWTAVRVFPEYLRLMLVPLDLVPDYGPGVIVPETSWFSPLVLLGVLTAAVTAAVGVLAWTRIRLVSLGILWFAGVLFPVSNLVLTTGILLAERTLYLPSVGFAVAVAGVAGALAAALRSDERRLRMATAVLALVLVLFGIRTWTQNRVWRDHAAVARLHRLLNEPERESFTSSSLAAPSRLMSAISKLEAGMVLIAVDRSTVNNPGDIQTIMGTSA